MARVQYKSAEGSGVSSLSVTFDNPTTAGNAVFALSGGYYDGGSGALPWSYADNNGGSYTTGISGGQGSVAHMEVAAALAITGRSGHQVTLTLTGSGYPSLTAVEHSGVSGAYDTGAIGTYNNPPGTTYTSGSISPANADTLLLGIIKYFTQTTFPTVTPDAGWSLINNVNTVNADAMGTQDRVVSALGSYAASGTFSAQPSVTNGAIALIAAYPMGTPPPPTPPDPVFATSRLAMHHYRRKVFRRRRV